jgi:aryl-alcohol dehydrogenase-like predicted oxidoreductase
MGAGMQSRHLGKNGPPVSVIGFGAWPIGGGLGAVDKNTAIRTVQSALDAGITMIDTAEGYRGSEAILGEALTGSYREKCFLATKASTDFTRKGIRKAMEKSLRALRVDHVDLYQIHSWNPAVPVEGSMEEMARLLKEGKTRYIGVSNFGPEHLERALKVSPVHSNQVRYNMFFRDIEEGTIEYCEKHGIGIIVHSPLAKGLLTGAYTADSRFSADDERSGFPDFKGPIFELHLEKAQKIRRVADRKGMSLVQLAIAWTLLKPVVSCTLVGAKNPAQVLEHVHAPDSPAITTSECDEIDRILAEV